MYANPSYGILECFNDLNKSMVNTSYNNPTEQKKAIDNAMIQFIQLKNMKLLDDLIAHPPEIWEKYKGLVERLSNPPVAGFKEFEKPNADLTAAVVTRVAKTQKILLACKTKELLSSYIDFMRERTKSGHGKLTPLMYAIKTKNIQMIRILHETGEANVNEVSPPGITPLMSAVAQGDIAMVKLLCALGAYMNPPNTINSLIGVAINIQNIQAKDEIMRYLYAQGAEIDQPNKNGMTPMAMAAIRGDVITMQLLHDLDLSSERPCINLNRLITIEDFEQSTLPLLSVLILNNQTAEVELLKAWGADQESALDIIADKRIAQVWGIGDEKAPTVTREGSEFLLEGLNPKYAIKMLYEYVNDFFLLNQKIDPKNKAIILSSIESAFPLSYSSDENTLRKLQLGEPIVILGSFVNHAISIVIKDRQIGICNRGKGGTADGIEFYSIPESFDDKDIIELIKKLTIDPDVNVFNMIRKLNPLQLPGIKPKKPQEIGNCAWAGSKGILEILCIFLGIKDMTVSKDFTTYAREKELGNYLRNAQHLDVRILKEIREKINEKSEKPGFLLDQNLMNELRSKLRELADKK